MGFQRTSVGIDIGSHSVKVVHLRVTEQGAFVQNALYFDRADLEARGVSLEDRPALAALLRAQMNELKIPCRNVILGVSGDDAILRYTSISPVPAWRLKIIMGYEVAEVAERVGETLASDFRVLSVRREKDDDQVVLVALVKEEPLENLLRELGDAGILVDRCVPTSLSLAASWDAFGEEVDPDAPEDDFVTLIDIGHTSVSCALVLNGNLVFSRSVRYGGQNLTENIARDLGVDPDKAEQLKIKRGTVDLANVAPGAEQLTGSIRAGATQIQSLIQSSLRVARTQTGVALPAPGRIVLSGGTTRLDGLASFLERSLKAPVELFKPQRLIVSGQLPGKAGEILARFPGDLIGALGLAVAGVRESEASLRIIPESYQKKRDFRERTLFLHASAAILVLSLLLAGADGWLRQSRAEEQEDLLIQTKNRLQGQRREMQEFSQENGRVRSRINRILREVEVTAFQAFLMEYFSTSLRPEIRLSRVRFSVEENENSTNFNYGLIAECIADNSDQNALQLISELQDRLAADRRVSRVDIENSRPESTLYKFELVVRPAFQGYQ